MNTPATDAAVLNKEEVKVVTATDAKKALKDAVHNLRTHIHKSHHAADNKAPIEVEAKHYLDIAKETAAFAVLVENAQEQLKVIDAQETLESFDLKTKLKVLGLTKEEILAAFGMSDETLVEHQGKNSTDNKEITIKYLTPDGEVGTVKLTSVYQKITAEDFASDVVDFWNWAQEQTEAKTITRAKKRGTGTTAVKADKNYLSDVSDEELKEVCKAYYTAA